MLSSLYAIRRSSAAQRKNKHPPFQEFTLAWLCLVLSYMEQEHINNTGCLFIISSITFHSAFIQDFLFVSACNTWKIRAEHVGEHHALEQALAWYWFTSVRHTKLAEHSNGNHDRWACKQKLKGIDAFQRQMLTFLSHHIPLQELNIFHFFFFLFHIVNNNYGARILILFLFRQRW